MTQLIGPGSTIGIMGAGQLGRMLAVSARQMGYRVAVFGGDRTSPAGQISDRAWSNPFDDQDALAEFAAACDVVTYEFENISAEAAATISKHVPLRPGVELLSTAQNRFAEKSALSQLGLTTAGFRMVHSADELTSARSDFGGRIILKANTEGYDGKGQWAIDEDTDIPALWNDAGLTGALVEQRIDFEFELSIVAGRYDNGNCVFFDPMLNHHANHILDVSVSASPLISDQTRREAIRMARSVLEHFDVVGVLCIELFLDRNGRLLVNEIAPRPHNSGHLTIEAYNCSQFELQLRTICGLPSADLQRRAPAAAMSNLLGQHLPAAWTVDNLAAFDRPETHLHLYGKPEARTNRKMGHITVTAEHASEAERVARRCREQLLK
ncbi:MAG: 5-(carboxyamino)imidazole ribonucleotide synthase [Planctomycetaceae bacterium]|nr:5-(carboxyamino)imidazole ribonucleotide synthase [Planctomycetaceae bacterium]